MTETYVIDRASTLQWWDEQTLAEQGITSLELMERAALAFVGYFREHYPVDTHQQIDVLCGPGNNGGDGAAIARLLERGGYTTNVWAYYPRAADRAGDLKANWDALRDMRHARLRENEPYEPTPNVAVVVDALFGVGLSRPLEGAHADTIRTANAVRAHRVAVDVPSGQKIDGSEPTWPCFHATATITFEALKQSALFPETGAHWGETTVVRIGLVVHPHWLEPETPRLLTGRNSLYGSGRGMLGPRERFTHKGTYGHVLVVAGSRGHAGAALLCGRGAYNAGAGLVTFYVPERLEPAMQVGLPEAMCLTDGNADHLTRCPQLDRYDAVVVGPGIGQHPETAAMLAQLFAGIGGTPCVIDADALNLIAADEALLDALPKRAILTPHPGEFARLAGEARTGYERLRLLISYESVLPLHAAIVVKGHYTVVTHSEGEKRWNFYHGNPGMATGGMGDVLAGVIAALSARGAALESPRMDTLALDAAALGVLAHARAGDLARDRWGEDGITAGRVADEIGMALRAVYLDE